MQQTIFIADVIACSTCFRHHYAHHQELESIIQVVAACRIWCLVFNLSVWCGAEGYVSGLRATIRSAIKIICCIWLAFYFHISSSLLYNTCQLQLSHYLISDM